MCLAIPGTVVSTEGDFATVRIGGMLTKASLQLIEDVQVDDYVLIHSGFIIEKITAEEAHETLQIISEIMNLDDTAGKEIIPDE